MTSSRPASAHLPTHVVRRARLVESMSRPEVRLIVVTGPAGSGKSVAVRDWTTTTSRPTAWLSLEGRHADPEHFLDSLLEALEEVAPGVQEATWRDDPGDRAADRAVERAVEHLAAGRAATLVLDDLHVVDHSPTADMLARLVDVLTFTNLTLVVCSRSDPPFHPHAFRLAGELVELRESDLRFDRDEAAEFFARFPEVELDRGHVELLAERTEGWAAGLQFAALSLAGRDDADAFVERFAGSDRHVADFLLDEVLDRQPEDVHDFLLMTSLLDRMRTDLCEQVTGRADAGALLRRIEAEHLFVVPLDDDREWFRYHHLFGQLLRRELRVTRPELEREGHERAAIWYVEHGEPDHAIDHLLDAGNLDGAFDLLREHLYDYLRAGRQETVRGWLGRFPTAFVDATPGHQLLVALGHARSGQVEDGRRVIERARGRSSAHDMGDLALHYDVTETSITALLGDPDTAVALGLKAWDQRAGVDLAALPADVAGTALELWGYLPVALARACALLDDRSGVRRWSTIVRRQGPRLPSDLVSILGAEAWTEARSGRLRAAEELAGEALALGTEVGRGARRAMISARVTMALVHRQRDDLDAAVEVLAPHLDPARREGHVAVTTLGEVELARVECARGQAHEAVARLLRVRRDREARGLPVFLAGVLDRAECRVRLHAGDVDRAQDLLDELDPGPERDLLAVRVALALDRLDAVEPLLTGVRATTGDDRRLSLEAAALAARASAEAGDISGARRVLAEVADVARREGALRTFLDEGWDIRELPEAGMAPAAGLGPGPSATGRAAAAALVEPLSERELSVLRYLPSRLSNREIGAELYVSLNTVKSHLKAIYRKLGVESRDEAVRRGRQLGLL